MRTRIVGYGRLKSLEGYNHVRFYKEIELDPGDDESTATDALRHEVDEALGMEEERVTLVRRIEFLRQQHQLADRDLRRVREQRDDLKARLVAMENFIEAAGEAGVEVPEDLNEELPF